MKNLVGFITPDNDVITMKMTQVLEYCKNLCFDEKYYDSFTQFEKDYTYFNSYFDFVLTKLNYLFINPLFYTGKFIACVENAFYMEDLDTLDYTNNMEKISSKLNDKELANSILPFMTTVANTELGLEKAEYPLLNCIIDSNLTSIMSKTGTINGSHGISANSVVNQLVLMSPKIAATYYAWHQIYEGEDSEALNFAVTNLGFIRATSPDVAFIIGNDTVLTNPQKQLISKCKEKNYNYISIDSEADSLVEEYQNILSQNIYTNKHNR